MKPSRFLFILLVFLAACGGEQKPTLDQAILSSLQKNDFNELNDFLPDLAFYKSLGEDMPYKTDSEINKFLQESNDLLKQDWVKMKEVADSRKIDLSKVKIREAIYFDPLIEDTISEALLLNYDYEGNIWDDLSFIIARSSDRIFLLSIPNTGRVFSMTDPDLNETRNARLVIRSQQPEFKKEMEDLAARVVQLAKQDNDAEFGKILVYQGEDENRKWKSALNLSNADELGYASGTRKGLKDALEECAGYETGPVLTSDESEGVWYVLPLQCENKFIYLAFLNVDDQFLLGDVRMEEK